MVLFFFWEVWKKSPTKRRSRNKMESESRVRGGEGGEDEEEKKKQSGKEKKEPKRSIAREERRLVGDDK